MALSGSGSPDVNSTNFRSDVNANGAINSTDVSIIKNNLP